MQCMAAGHSVEVARDYTCDQVYGHSKGSHGSEKADCCGQGACMHNTNKYERVGWGWTIWNMSELGGVR